MRFFLQNYEGAIEAYTEALKYDPENAASKSYLAKAKAKLERQQQQQSSAPPAESAVAAETPSRSTGENARRLLEDPAMQLLAKKALSTPSSQLMDDPEMANIARQAMSDPTMMEAVRAVQHVRK